MDDFGIGNNIRKKRTQTCRRPKPEAQAFSGSHNQASISSTPPSDDASKLSSDDNGVDANPRQKVLNLNQCIGPDGNGGSGDVNEEAQSGLNHNHGKFRKVKLKVGGATRTIQPKSLILQENSDEDHSPNSDKKIGLQGIPWKDFSRAGFKLGGEKQGEKSERVRKSKRVPKKRDLEVDSDDDDEIRYLEKLKTVKVSAAYKDFDEDSMKKSDSVSMDTDYEEEEHVSGHETEVKNRKRETTLTSRQRALLSGRESGAEFPNGLPPAPSRKQKEKLTEVEQQLKRAEAAERRRMQNEKAARESEAEAIRKILGQDSSRKKREDKLLKRREELARERAENAKMLAPNTVRTVFGPNGIVVSFAEDIGLPCIFDPKPCCYPGPRAKCVGPSCSNPYKYRDSKSNLPVCSLRCYKAVRERMKQPETAC